MSASVIFMSTWRVPNERFRMTANRGSRLIAWSFAVAFVFYCILVVVLAWLT